jgi:photosystem II stability/assembly factor-like uncharacterized protein
MNGQSSEGRDSNADRRIGEWADLSSMSRPPAARPEVLSAKVEVAAAERRRSRRSVPGLAMALVVVLVVAGVGFVVSRQPSAVAPSASASAVVSPSGPPGPSASPSPLVTSTGDGVADIQRIDERNGWAYVRSTGSKLGTEVPMLLMTDDGGATWRDATPPNAESQPVIEFFDAEHGWFLDAEGPLWRTADGGRSWNQTTLPAGRTGMSAAMSFVSASTGYLLLSANSDKDPEPWSLYRTDDGGASLQRVGAVTLPDEPPMSGPLPVIAFSGPLDGVIAGWRAVIRTRDGGAHWSTVSLPQPQGSTGFRYIGAQQLQAFGSSLVLLATMDSAAAQTDESTTYVSDDAGLSWRPAYTESAESGTDVWAIVDGLTWLDFTTVEGPIQVRATSDAGETWTTSTGAGLGGRDIWAVSFVSATDGWAIFQVDSTCPAGEFCGYQGGEGQLAETHDGGVTWQLVP